MEAEMMGSLLFFVLFNPAKRNKIVDLIFLPFEMGVKLVIFLSKLLLLLSSLIMISVVSSNCFSIGA